MGIQARKESVKKGNDSKQKNSTNGSDLDFEAQLWAAADRLRGHMDAPEYKHVCLLSNESDRFRNDDDVRWQKLEHHICDL